MAKQSLINQVVASVKFVGYRKTLDVIISRLADLTFDYRFKTDTAECVALQDLQIKQENIEKGQRYQPTGILPFKKLMGRLELPSDSVFIDFGSGKGRVLLMASQFNFKRVVGVEFSEELCRIAKDNIETFTKKVNGASRIDVIECDASEYAFNDDENVFYFFYPFDEEVMNKVVANIITSLKRKPRQAFLIYHLPKHVEVIEKQAAIFKEKTSCTLSGYECAIFKADTRVNADE